MSETKTEPQPVPPEEPRRRAEAAEARAAQLERELAATREALDAAERRRTIAEALAQADALDLETAALLTEAAVAQMPEADVGAAIADLKRRKPFLFRQAARAGAMSPALRAAGPRDALAEAAAAARESGDRRALLEYLRLRRR